MKKIWPALPLVVAFTSSALYAANGSLFTLPGRVAAMPRGVLSPRATMNYVVTTTANSGAGSLRQAILDANANANTPDTISFAIPSGDVGCDASGVCTIAPITALPVISDAVIIDGYTQSGATPNTNPVGQGLNSVLKIVLDGNAVRGNNHGLEITGGAATIRGLVINRWSSGAVRFESGGGNKLEGCYIGTDASGTARTLTVDRAFSPGVDISFISNDNNIIGGTAAAARNLISGNGLAVSLSSNNNRVLGNLIGTDRSGMVAIANADGVGINFSTGNIIGAPGAGNVICGSVATSGFATGAGIAINGDDNVVAANFIGVNVNGSAALPNALQGIYIYGSSANNLIGGTGAAERNVISGNGANGIEIFGQNGQSDLVAQRFQSRVVPRANKIQGNYIGTSADGTSTLPNRFGVVIYGSDSNQIGGAAAGAGNLISGNRFDGINLTGISSGGPMEIQRSRAAGDIAANGNANLIAGNLIGLNAAGTGALGNGDDGIDVDSSSDNQIGGTTAAERNVIAANGDDGIEIDGGNDADSGADATRNTIQGNYIGTNAAGNAAFGNGDKGISVEGASSNRIGGGTAGAGNVISGSGSDGIFVTGAQGRDNQISGNRIGVAANGTTALGNAGRGIALIVSGPNTIGGGFSPANANIIANNRGAGVGIVFAGGLSIRKGISENSIYNNGGLGIDLEDDGVTLNDVGDADTGANEHQNFPVLTAATLSGGNVAVRGTLNSVASKTYRLEFFANAAADPSGYGEGQTFLASINVTTDASGNATFNENLNVALPSGQNFISATATDPQDNTSEFSQTVSTQAAQPSTLSINNAAAVAEGDSGQANNANFTVTLAPAAAQEVRVSYQAQSATATEGVDFVRTTGTLIFAPGETTKTISVPIIGDTIAENNETFTVVLSAPLNATLGTTSTGTGTITDDDAAKLTLSIAPTTFSEAAGATAATATVTRNTATTAALTVNLLSSNPAKVTVPATVTIPAGQTAVQFALTAVDNTTVDGSATVTISAGSTGLATATANVTVTDNDSVTPPANRAPVAQNQTLSTPQDTALKLALTATDADSDALTFRITTQPKNGKLSGNATNLTYTPNASFVGSDSFTFVANDGKVDSNAATIALQVLADTPTPPATGKIIEAVNDSYNLILGAPERAQNSGVTLLDDGTFHIAARGVIANDRALVGKNLSARLARGPQNGRILVNADGSFDYQPSSGFAGSDEFTYTLSDGQNSDTARVRLIVLDRRGPELRFDVPRDGATGKGVNEIRGRVRDRESGVKSMSLLWRRESDKAFWNGSAWTSSATPLSLTVEGTFWKYEGALPASGDNRETDLLDGEYALRATALDNAGNTSRLLIEFAVDNSAPATPDFSDVRLSSAGASAEQGAIALRFTGALDSAAAADTMNYTVIVNGVEIEIAAVDYASNLVTLSGLDLSAGDEIELQISGLRDADNKVLRSGIIGLSVR